LIKTLIREFAKRIQQSTERIGDLEKLVQEKTEGLEAAKQLLVKHQAISLCQINAVESKYVSIKQLNIGLERRLIELESELEKHKLLLTKVTEGLSQKTQSSNSASTSPVLFSVETK